MGLLHRVYAGSISEVWTTQGRLLHTFGLVRRPVAAQWLVTAACDMKCPHCYSAAGKRTPGELTTDEAKHLVIDALVDLGCPMLVLAGGELLLRPDIPALVAYACERGLQWSMHTHGLHVPRFAELFARHPPALAAISLDGDRSFHDAFRGRAGSFDAALHAAQLLADSGCREVVLGTTVTRDNADAIADMYPLVARSRAHSWGLHLFAPEGRGHDHAELFPTPAQLRRVAAFARRRRGEYPIELCNEWGSAGADDLYYRDQPFSCGAGTLSFVISANGDVLPCTTTDPAEREGNVRSMPLREIWAQRFDRFRSGSCVERGECWLQTRNGVRCSEDAFGPVARPEPLWVERWPRRARTGRALIGERSAAAVGLVAAGLVFLQGCAKPATVDTPVTHVRPDGLGGGDPRDGGERWAVEAVGVPEGFPEVLAARPEVHFNEQAGLGSWPRLRAALLACERDRSQCQAAADTAAELATMIDGSPGDSPVWRGAEAWKPYVEGLAGDRAHALGNALAVLDVVELRPTYDAALAAQLWRTVRALPVADEGASAARVRLYARLRQHHRVIDALKRAELAHGPVQVRPWMKKSMPPPDFKTTGVPEGLIDTAASAYGKADAGTWDTLTAELSVRGRGVVLAKAGRVSAVADGAVVSLSRLDVAWCAQAVVLTDRSGRSLAVPAGTEVTLFDLSSWLSKADRAAIETQVGRAMLGDAAAADAIEMDLALAHDAIAAALRTAPGAAGAAALRMLLVQFDE